jgi:predicted O-methyltransferase YrrM
MSPDEVHQIVRGYPNMNLGQGRNIYEQIRKNGYRRILELGFNWGVSTCYLASAIADQPDGHVVTIDLANRVAFRPGVEGFLEACGLSHATTVFYEHSSYTWRLRAFLRMDPRPEFDLIYLDGGHLWESDALAFLLAEQMLRPGGMFIFDDLHWTIGGSTYWSDTAAVKDMPADERDTPHVQEIFDLLVKPHPNIVNTFENSSWGFAVKRKGVPFVWNDQAPVETRLAAAAAETKSHASRLHPTPIQLECSREDAR